MKIVVWAPPPQSKILAMTINWIMPEKIFEDLFCFWRTLAAVSLVLGLEHACPWLQEGLSLALDFFVSLASSLVSSTPPLIIAIA